MCFFCALGGLDSDFAPIKQRIMNMAPAEAEHSVLQWTFAKNIGDGRGVTFGESSPSPQLDLLIARSFLEFRSFP